MPGVKKDEWRENFKGVRYYHKPTGLIVTGAIDDLWISSKNEYIVVDYKATAKTEPATELTDTAYHNGYRRQLEIYQWLLHRNGLMVTDTGYLVYCTGKPNEKRFDSQLNFDIYIITHKESDDWVESTIAQIKQTLDSPTIPDPSPDCD